MVRCVDLLFFFFFNDTATTEIYTLSLHDALPISMPAIVIREPSSEVVPRRTVPAFVTLMKPLKRNTPSSRLLVAPTNEPEIGRARVGKECRSRWSPYH